MTEYQALTLNDATAWEEVGEPVEASSEQAAIRKVVSELDPDTAEGFWRAIPTRSWRPEPERIEIEIATKVTFRGGDDG